MQSYTKFASASVTGSSSKDNGAARQLNDAERLVIALDNSCSMEDTDYPPTRLAAGIEAIKHLLEIKAHQTPQDQVAILTFSSSFDVMTPLVPVRVALTLFVAGAPMILPESSTNITAGLKSAQNLLNPVQSQSSSNKGVLDSLLKSIFEPDLPQAQKPNDSQSQDRLIILTDGDANAGGCPVRAAKQLKKQGVCIDVIGIGGSPEVVDRRAPKIASTYPDDSPRYCFIGDTDALIKEFGRLAGHIKIA